MRQLFGLAFLCGVLAFLGCQQTQEADDDDGETTVIEEETVIEDPAPEPDLDMDVQMEGGDGGASGEVSVEGN